MKYLPFTAIDGESINDNYCLLSTQHESVYKHPRLSSKQCLDFIMRQSGIIVGFSLHFDVCHILRDLPNDKLKKALRGERTIYADYDIQYLNRKMLIIYHAHKKRIVYDTWGFFQSSFIKAAQSLGFTIPESIVSGKLQRAAFKREDIESIKAYNTDECILLADMMSEFRTRVSKSFAIRSWHGAGAISQSLLRKWTQVKGDMQKLEVYPRAVKDHFDEAFYGGRIELMTVGTRKNIYQYDIRSAYPAALANIPKLPDKFKSTNKHISGAWGVYRIEWDFTPQSYKGIHICPFPVRSNTGLVTYPLTGSGWYSSCEVDAALKVYPPGVKVIAGHVWSSDQYPYGGLVNDLYNTRALLKANNDGSQIGYKLGLNSLYGKLAQREGKYHHPILKTLITGYTRATMFSAAMQSPQNIISFSTDSIASTKALNLSIGTNLGEYEANHYDEGLFLMSGIYKLDDTTRKIRGFKQLDMLKCAQDIDTTGETSITFTSFVSPLLANGVERIEYTFKSFTKQLHIYNNVKRDYEFLHTSNPHKRKSLLNGYWNSKAWYESGASRDIIKRNKADICILE